jgi:hypothetical protein
VKATVNTFKKAISFKNDVFSNGSSGDPDVILDPFEFRYLARIFLTIRLAQRGQTQAVRSRHEDSRAVYSANRYFEVSRDTKEAVLWQGSEKAGAR